LVLDCGFTLWHPVVSLHFVSSVFGDTFLGIVVYEFILLCISMLMTFVGFVDCVVVGIVWLCMWVSLQLFVLLLVVVVVCVAGWWVLFV